ncbi:MAG: hypothetical protein AAEJ52_20770, partial [Myxococcota bacterium]
MDRKAKRKRSAVFDSLSTFGVNAGLVAEIHERYEVDPDSVDASWAAQFGDPLESIEERAADSPGAEGQSAKAMHSVSANQFADRHARVLRMIHAYRSRGHRIADTDPLSSDNAYFPELDPAHYGFGTEEFDQSFIAGDLPG